MPDWLAIVGLSVGIAGGVLAIVGIIVTVLIYRATNGVSERMIAIAAHIEDTTTILKTLVDGLLGTMTGHLTRQNEAIVDRLLAAQVSVGDLAKPADAEKKATVEELESQMKELRTIVGQVGQLVIDDMKSRPVLPAWAAPPLLASDPTLGAAARLLAQRRVSTVAPSASLPEAEEKP